MSRRKRGSSGGLKVTLPGLPTRDGVALGLGVLLVLAVLLGGASRDHALRLSLLELAALPLLSLAALRLYDAGKWKSHRFALAIAASLVAIPLLQLIPLPPAIWQSLPGREQASLALEIAGIAPGWTPYSLTPDMTQRSLLALLPPLAVFLATLSVSQATTKAMVRLLIALAGAGVLLGMVQLLSGSQAFYPWQATDAGEVTGFFANRNHLATLSLIALPFCALMAGREARRGAERRAVMGMWLVLIAVILVGLTAIQSRTGVALALPVLLASLLVGRMAAGRTAAGPRLLAAVGVGLIVVAAVSWAGSGAMMDRFQADSEEQRFEGWPIVVEAAQAHLPAGAGMGSFDRVFRSVEPLEQVDETYFNRAHNDYLETWLEAGWLAAAVLVAFLIWLGRRTAKIWRSPDTVDPAAPAAVVAILVVLAHSAVDYPLRTVTVAAVLALCCALVERRGEGVRRRVA